VGLALAQKLVASLGGALELETAEGRGARFRVRLPLREAQP
jgi:signal transduction histidine kinase